MKDEAAFNTIAQFCSPAGGVLLVQKPREWTSFDVVKKVRGMLRVKKVGHAGTLDPLATGMLILCSQKLTKEIDRFQALDKTYEGDLILGGVTASYDAGSEVTDEKPYAHLNRERIEEASRSFIGAIEQCPPMFSAVKVDGKRLYTLARKGLEVERKLRPVQVHSMDITDVELPRVSFRIVCSKGTYVRSIVHDLGQALGCGAYLNSLSRSAIGPFSLDEAWTIDGLTQAVQPVPAKETETDLESV